MQDDKLKNILSGTMIKTSENLKFRIMQQLETEKALVPKKKVKSRPVIGNMLTIFGIMYALIALIGFFVYSSFGMEALRSTTFYVPVLLVSSVCGVFWLISVYDDRRHSKDKDGVRG